MSVIFAFVAGALSFFSPCIFPFVPAYVAHLTGTPIRENRIRVGKREILMRSLAFIGGFSVIFVLMGATASAIGQMLVQYLDEKGEVSRQYEAQAIPTSYLIDSKGIIRKKMIGPMSYDWMVDQMESIQ
ncbi:cytochrome c biogenesis protein CcdA [Geobacillus sp. C56-T3]|uniref:cytochrome c biogenesis protein CcdA n=1 Tax=Geobacillus sp. (strain C56-T3) TaxID=691437 RepID=UPI0009FDBBAB|nr:cytochrome c biogenesis protein CcdA [Geobacillus sp. C56-T3]